MISADFLIILQLSLLQNEKQISASQADLVKFESSYSSIPGFKKPPRPWNPAGAGELEMEGA